MGFGCALDLRDLDERFVAIALVGIGGIKRVAIIGFEPEHLAVGHIRIVRDGDRLAAIGALRIHPVPEVFRISGIKG